MVATAKHKQLDEALINFYDEHLVAHADAAYRMAYALTLSLDGASQLSTRVFQQAASSLERFHAAGEQAALPMLVQLVWKCFKELGNAKLQEAQSPVTKALRAVPLEGRAALVAVDVAGLSASDAAKAFEWTEKDLRAHLAGARRALMMSTLT